MIVDLKEGLSTEMVDELEWVDELKVRVPQECNAKDLAEALAKMPVAYPSSAFEDGEFLWDYKDGNTHTFNVKSQIAHAIEGLEITGQSAGPRYWFISFTYKGEEAGIGPGYKYGSK